MSLSQVVPAESEGQEGNTESIDLFEVLEDRYAYEGFNKFAFYLTWFIVIYHLHLSSWYYDDVGGEKLLLRRIPNDGFERKEFNAWGIKYMKDVTTDLEYFGDQFILTRVTAGVSTTLCNNLDNCWNIGGAAPR